MNRHWNCQLQTYLKKKKKNSLHQDPLFKSLLPPDNDFQKSPVKSTVLQIELEAHHSYQ